jgi:DNA-binding transcriptional LysR family regulator
MDWDDLRYVLALGHGRTLSAAGRALGVNHSTVFRRVRLIEERLGVRLFERHRDGYTPTPAGEEAVALAERLGAEVDSLEQHLAGRDTRPSVKVDSPFEMRRWRSRRRPLRPERFSLRSQN